MNLDLGNYVLSADSHQFLLHKKSTKEDSKSEYSSTTYHPTLELVANKLIEQHIKDSEIVTIEELLQVVEVAKDTVLKALEEAHESSTSI